MNYLFFCFLVLAVNRNEEKLWGLATECSSTWRKVLLTVYLPHQDNVLHSSLGNANQGLFLASGSPVVA